LLEDRATFALITKDGRRVAGRGDPLAGFTT
jgi:hypothetical protein